MMRLLVLGARGKLACLLRAAWPESGEIEPVWLGADDQSRGLDLLNDTDQLARAMTDADVILNLAGVTRERGGRRFADNPAIAQNSLQCADGRPVLLCSSAAVYGNTKALCHEDMPPAPLSAYGRSKQEMERIAQGFDNAICLRMCNVAGADALLAQDRDAYRLDQFPDGSFPSRSYIGPHHLALILQELATITAKGHALPDRLNLAADPPVTMDALLSEAGKTWTPVPAPPEAIAQVHLDISRLTNLIATKSPYPSVIEDLNALKG
ncbi:MAG: NAD-dependent epimerase/dehydratase family protein [Pseudomonadota bacterium]